MGYMFLLHIESSGPQDVDPDIQTFTSLWDPQRLQSKNYASMDLQLEGLKMTQRESKHVAHINIC